ncbi:hypothetical protein Pcinc_034436 [Petrolisthes cinctipes]|uniref:Uncharacterized protein n=1 Tax=Petrolisthes cinctipes TaxID=88211 RepID=A0AAE1EQB2_PETCI|nr:hypothetical protein Pcinc_034436 [Petrolisthes cinctipes]
MGKREGGGGSASLLNLTRPSLHPFLALEGVVGGERNDCHIEKETTVVPATVRRGQESRQVREQAGRGQATTATCKGRVTSVFVGTRPWMGIRVRTRCLPPGATVSQPASQQVWRRV